MVDIDTPFRQLGRLISHPFLFMLRAYYAYTLFEHGMKKWGNLDGTSHFFDKLGIPFPYLNAIAVAFVETALAATFGLGFLSHFSAFAIVVVMSVAMVLAHPAGVSALLSFNLPKFLAEGPAPFLVASLVVLVAGAGVFSLDYLFARGGSAQSKPRKRE